MEGWNKHGGSKDSKKTTQELVGGEIFFWSLGDLKVETEVLVEGEQNKRIAVHEPSAATPSSACILICNCLQPTVHCNDVKHHKFLVHLSKLANGAHLLHTAQCAFGTISTDASSQPVAAAVTSESLDSREFSIFFLKFHFSISSHFYFTFNSRSHVIFFTCTSRKE